MKLSLIKLKQVHTFWYITENYFGNGFFAIKKNYGELPYTKEELQKANIELRDVTEERIESIMPNANHNGYVKYEGTLELKTSFKSGEFAKSKQLLFIGDIMINDLFFEIISFFLKQGNMYEIYIKDDNSAVLFVSAPYTCICMPTKN